MAGINVRKIFVKALENLNSNTYRCNDRWMFDYDMSSY